MARIYHYTFILFVNFIILKYKLFIIIQRPKKVKKSIAALPYYPQNWPGGADRIAAWKPYFEKEDINFNVFWAWEADELRKYFEYTKAKNQIKRYKLFFRLLNRRWGQLNQILQHDTIWIQRAFLPLYPFKKTYFEKLLHKLHPNVIYDFYDADYESNYNLVMQTVRNASKVTVASEFLKEKFKQYNKSTHFVRFAIRKEQFVTQPDRGKGTDTVKIGWMGSPDNAKQLLHIAGQLQKIENEYPQVKFSFVCRDLPELGLKRAEVQKWGEEGFDYYHWLASLDVGLVPFIKQTDRQKAKISMKCLEFMGNGISLISSPNIHADQLEDGKSFLLANENDWFEKIKLLIERPELRKKLGQKGKNIFYDYHTYEAVYPVLKEILLG
ncbi:hypothetical protein L21SP5_01964 [Salinivirga cyanobacteriivorans]|uniref:Spore protein YkvP/CgeB glycosyl transferase-like domain-containing protein n=1 Tax=Salinivirga cyanobacteriivorans TaxID=1307839 RepID=A0A0S2HZR7_9BACT|nr:glycosyltransferase [Salinivirga cyanobacteriivorans]ALO15603.1 hypothetical protein L21SP5_01964 [Salinivirga cyanobacteriivorans]